MIGHPAKAIKVITSAFNEQDLVVSTPLQAVSADYEGACLIFLVDMTPHHSVKLVFMSYKITPLNIYIYIYIYIFLLGLEAVSQEMVNPLAHMFILINVLQR